MTDPYSPPTARLQREAGTSMALRRATLAFAASAATLGGWVAAAARYFQVDASSLVWVRIAPSILGIAVLTAVLVATFGRIHWGWVLALSPVAATVFALLVGYVAGTYFI